MLAVKVITGFRKDQEYSIPAEEAHKAYYLFTHPDERGVFSNGVAIVGAHIQSIVPDYHTSMGWNPEYRITADDMTQVIESGTARKLRNVLKAAREVATLGIPEAFNMTLKDARTKYLLGAPDRKVLTGKALSLQRKELADYKASKLGRTPLHINKKAS